MSSILPKSGLSELPEKGGAYYMNVVLGNGNALIGWHIQLLCPHCRVWQEIPNQAIDSSGNMTPAFTCPGCSTVGTYSLQGWPFELSKTVGATYAVRNH